MLVLALKISRHQHTLHTASLVWIDSPWLVKQGSSPMLSNHENPSSCGITLGGLQFAPAVWGSSQAVRIWIPTCCALMGVVRWVITHEYSVLLILFTPFNHFLFIFMMLTCPQWPDKPIPIIEPMAQALLVSQEASCCCRLVARCHRCAIPSHGL